MSYKRVVKKNGKVHGPYIYESYRDENGKVKKRYLGKVEESKKKSLIPVFLLAVFSFVFLLGVGYTTDFYFNEGDAFDFSGEVLDNVYGGFTGLAVNDEEVVPTDDEIEDKVVDEEVVEESVDESDGEDEEPELRDGDSGSDSEDVSEVPEEVVNVDSLDEENNSNDTSPSDEST